MRILDKSMKNFRLLLLVVVIAAVAASIWLFRPQSSETASGQVADSPLASIGVNGPVAAIGPSHSMGGGRTMEDPVVVAVENGASLMSALKAHAVDGRIESEAQANLALLGGNCHEAPNLAPVASDGFYFDDTRAWAIARQLEICAGYDPKQFRVTLARPDLIGSNWAQGWAATENLATESIATSGIMLDVFTAGQLMMENDAFPFDQVLPGMQKEYGPDEIAKAWLRASQLATCDKVGGCGKESFEVVLLCANLGCKQGLNLTQALEQRLPPSDYRATMAMYAWLNRRRSGT